MNQQEKNKTSRTVVLAAGGTGGHIFPAQALAEELVERGVRVVLVTDRRFANYVRAFNDVEVRIIRSGSLSGNIIHRVLSLFNLAIGVVQAWRILKELKPVAVVGFGGYPSFPTMVAAGKGGYYTIIHEQNSVLGRANRVLAGWVSKIATSFKEVSHVPEHALSKLTFTGNPVRQGIRALRDVPYRDLAADGKFHVLIMGGSQGATVFSKIVPEAMRRLPVALRNRLRIDQQCRPADIEDVRGIYDSMAVNANLATFFNDVPARLASAHLVIARAGASTVAELLTAGRPAILVPYTKAMDDHQTFNANTVEDAGGGWLMPESGFTPEALSDKLEQFMSLPSTLESAAANARKGGHPEAVKQLAELVIGTDSPARRAEDLLRGRPEMKPASITQTASLQKENAA